MFSVKVAPWKSGLAKKLLEICIENTMKMMHHLWIKKYSSPATLSSWTFPLLILMNFWDCGNVLMVSFWRIMPGSFKGTGGHQTRQVFNLYKGPKEQLSTCAQCRSLWHKKERKKQREGFVAEHFTLLFELLSIGVY